MLPDLVPPDRALVHGLLGGMPLCLSWWDQGADVGELRCLACPPGAPLLIEAQLVLATEAEAGVLLGAALRAVASGRTRYGEITRCAPSRPGPWTAWRSCACWSGACPSPTVRAPGGRPYRVADPLGFSLGVLDRFRSEIDRGLGEAVLPSLLASLDDHLGAPWEEAVRDHLRLLAGRGELGGRVGEEVVAIGPWWSEASDAEVDAVVLAGRSRRPVAVMEATWAREADARRPAERLRRRAAAIPGVEDPDDLAVVVAARERLTHLPPDVRGLTAHDVYG